MNRLIKVDDVLERCTISRATLYWLIAKAYFPAQRKLYPEGALLNKEIGGSNRYCRFSIGFRWQSKSLKSTSERQQWGLEKKVGYHRRSVVETAMFRIKTLLGGHLSLRNYDAQVGEAMAMVKALNRMTLLAMPTSVRLV